MSAGKIVAAILILAASGALVYYSWFFYSPAGGDQWTAYALLIILNVFSVLWLNGIFWWNVSAPTAQATIQVEMQDRAEKEAIVHEGRRLLPTGRTEVLLQAALDRHPLLHPPPWLSHGQAILISLGLAGTFFGLTMGLMEAVPKLTGNQGEMEAGMKALLGGAKLAFAKSLAGVLCAMIWGLAYQQILQHKDQLISKLSDDLDDAFPTLSQERLLVDLLGRLQTLDSACVVERTTSAERHKTQLSVTKQVHKEAGELHVKLTRELGGHFSKQLSAIRSAISPDDRNLLDEVRSTQAAVMGTKEEVVHELKGIVEKMGTLADSLPEDVGKGAGAAVTSGLQPAFDKLSADLQALSAAGGKAIGDVIKGDVGAEVGELKVSLSSLNNALALLPMSISGAVDSANSQLAGGATQAADHLSSAASDVRIQVEALQASAGLIATALADTKSLASALSTAGSEVADKLTKVSEPLKDVPARLELVRDALSIAAGAINVATEKATAAATTTLAAQAASEFASAAFMKETTALAVKVKEAAGACENLSHKLGTATEDQQEANKSALADLTRALTEFQATLKDAGENLKTTTTGAFGAVETVSLAAAKRVADALKDGAEQMGTSMLLVAGHAEAVETSLAAARTATTALSSAAAHASATLHGAALPLKLAATSLEAVPTAVDAAVIALKAEEFAMKSLMASLSEQVVGARSLTSDIKAQVDSQQRVTHVQLQSIPAHLARVVEVNEKVKLAWSQALLATEQGLASNTKQLEDHVKAVERSLILPQHLSTLNDTMQELVGALDELKKQLRAKT